MRLTLLPAFALAVALGAGTAREARGTVTDSQGRPVPGAVLTVAPDPGGPVRTFRAGPDGRFRLTGLLPGQVHWVTCAAPGFQPRLAPLSLAGDDWVRLDLRLLTPAEAANAEPGVPLALPGEAEAMAAGEAYNAAIVPFNAGRFAEAEDGLWTAERLFSAALAAASTPGTRMRIHAARGRNRRILGCCLVERAREGGPDAAQRFARAIPFLEEALARDPGDEAVALRLEEARQDRTHR